MPSLRYWLVFLYLGLALPDGVARQEPTVVRFFGRVIDKQTKQPLPGAQVYLPELRRGTVTDDHGRFTIPAIPTGRHHVRCQLLGYADCEEHLLLQEDTEHIFQLEAEPVAAPAVTVTAERFARDKPGGSDRALAVLRGERLEKARGQSLGETLEGIAGVTVLQTGPAVVKPVVRGLHSDRVLVLNAGVTQEGQQWGGEHAPEIDPFAPARIEVLKGAAGVQYGVGAIGGVIRVEPRPLREHPGWGGEFWLNGFSNNLQAAGSLLLEGAPRQMPGLAWRLQGSVRRAGDARTPDFNIRNSGFAERSGSLGLGYDKGGVTTEVYFSHFGTELGIFTGSHLGNLTDLLRAIARGRPATDSDFSYEIRPPKQTISHNLLSVRSSLPAGRLGRLHLQYGWQQNHRQEFDAHKPYNDSLAALNRASLDLTLTTHAVDLTFAHHPWRNLFGKLGVSGMRQGNVQAGTILLIPNFRAHTGGAYVLETWTHGAWTINAGFRFDARVQRVYRRINREVVTTVHRYHNFTTVAGAIYQFAPSWALAANLGTAWRPPGINELYSNGVHHGTAQFEIGDPGLTRERSFNFDVTLKQQGKRSRLEFSAYRNRLHDFIFLFPQPEPTLTIRGAFPTFRFQQADAVIAGADGMAQFQLTDFFELGVSAAVVRGQNLETREPLFHMPADRLRLFTSWRVPAPALLRETHLDLAGTFVRRQTRVPKNADYAPPPAPYALLDLSLGGNFAVAALPVSFELTVQNLLNTAYRDYLSRYRYFIDDPGRSWILRLHTSFGLPPQE
ncbi:MAG: TonB-dependent receptor [candidate division KSB1 bacterium]|nr:TonB-dependent receptor [candidate division KSB1 bacterium]MDZ7273603.1 TonB-dependent receptor [candidate division KSB1 bacterium]MDZ7286806.1 TonB-dependent receptor [candidate division KSB1 bacterium]MDZ7299837.1 TonB-dependent receptor [candidate division KSB1 bacterium]MDZ7307750.1 TonB-dependent receptor [candidate division KSB1 bacterium]